jgi:peptide-methionine (S)-S-oxide reductase
VVRTRVGYSGGTLPNPTYRWLGDHTESLQIDYDPARISYEKLLEMFWATNNDCALSGSRQYMSAVFYHNDEQKRLALATRARAAARIGRPTAAAILPLDKFYLAEDYHQKYRLRARKELMREFKAMYPNDADFVNSTTAARVNGYLGGFGSAATLEKEIDHFGLSPDGAAWLWQRVNQNR